MKFTLQFDKQRLMLLAAVVSSALTMSAEERKIQLWGHVYDQFTHHAIRDAKATLMLSDSTVVDSTKCSYQTGGYYGTDTYYCFYIPRRAQKYIIRVTHPDYEDGFVNYEIKVPGRNTFFDAPWHYMKKKEKTPTNNTGKLDSLAAALDSIAVTHQLGEVVVKATRIKMVYKNDTIVYDAQAFQLPEGSMLDALVRQMPGVELKDDGTVLVNGERVEYLTLNGKEFFKGKNKVMLENLPLYAVDKVKIYRKSTEKSDWLGRDVEMKELVMDVHLKREYNEGYMANAEAAGGTKDRYLGRLFGLRFTDNSRLAGFLNANNVNETRHPGQNGEWTPEKSLGNGTTDAIQSGIEMNASDKKKRWDEQLTVNVGREKNEWETRELHETFATGGNLFNRSNEYGDSHSTDVEAANRFRLKNMFSPFKMTLTQRLQWGHYTDNGHGTTEQWMGTDTLNRTHYDARTQQPRVLRLFSGGTFNYRLPWGDDVELNLMANYNKDNGHKEQSDKHYDYVQEQRSEHIGRSVTAPNDNLDLRGDITYSIHALNNWNYAASLQARQQNTSRTQDHFFASDSAILVPDLDNTEHYSVLSRTAQLTLRAYYSKQQGERKTWLNMTVHANLDNDRINFHHARLDTVAQRTERYITYNGSFSRNTTRHGYELGVTSNISRQYIRDRIPYFSTTDPLRMPIHNPRIKLGQSHSMYWRFRTTVPEHQRNLTFNGSASIWLRELGVRQAYNTTTGALTLMSDNVCSPTWNINQEAHFNRPLDTKKRFTLEVHARINYQESNDYDVVQYVSAEGRPIENLLREAPISTVHNLYSTENLRLTYRINRFDLSAMGNFSYRHSTSDRMNFTTLNIFEYNYGFALNCRLPWKLQLAADAKMYSRRGYYSQTMNTDDFVCNASLSRTFLKESLTARLEAFDLFHQLRSTEYTLNAQGRVERWRKSIPSYLMLHLSWRWNHIPKKK